MNLLVTAGNTHAPIDRVRVITNVFTGRTGAAIALAARSRGHRVTLLTSHPETLPDPDGVRVEPYRTYDDLAALLEREVTTGAYDAVLHAAAVSDFLVAGAYRPGPGAGAPTLVEERAGKIKSGGELWLRLVPAPKLVDRIRSPWGFRGVLVKFKLEVGVGDDELLAVAERSRVQSAADLMVANTLEGAADYAYLGPAAGRYERVTRAELPGRLLGAIECRTS